MDKHTPSYEHITGQEDNDQLFFHLLESNQPWREEAVRELHRRGLTEQDIEAGIRAARTKVEYPDEEVAKAEIDRGINVTRKFFQGLVQ